MKSEFSTSYRTTSLLSEMNVTPFVDIMLVLLIVFMISAPFMQTGIPVDLPQAQAPALPESPEPLILSFKKDHQILLAGKPIDRGNLLKTLQSMVKAKPQLSIALQADQAVNYGDLAKLMSTLKKAGIQRIGLVTLAGSSDTHL